MLSTPANSWFWSTIVNAEETAKSSIFSAERYFSGLRFTAARTFNRFYSKTLWRTLPFTHEIGLSTSNGGKRENNYACQIETALHFFLRKVRNNFLRICNIFRLYYNSAHYSEKLFKKSSFVHIGQNTVFAVMGERPWCSEKSFRFVMFSGGYKKGIQSYSRYLTKSES